VHGLGAGPPGAFARLLEGFQRIGYDVRVLLVDCETAVVRANLGMRALLLGKPDFAVTRASPLFGTIAQNPRAALPHR
jgi:hypothetical protein